MILRNNRVLVTGGAGYIGSHTCKLLASVGYEPIVYDNLSGGFKKFVKWGPLVEGDLLDKALLQSTIETYRPIAVIHFAAKSSVGESVDRPLEYYINNVSGTLSLLDAMQATGIGNLVFSSSCITYGISDLHQIPEKHPQYPINPYGQSKLMIEKILSDMASRAQINFISLRYFNAAGADVAGEIGEVHDPETHLIPLAIQSAMGGPELNVYGTDFSTKDGTAVRDYIHVSDLATAHRAALECLLAGGHSDFFNLGTGVGYSVYEVIETLRSLGVLVKTKVAQRRSGDPAHLVADPKKAIEGLDWKLQFDTLEKILETAIMWHKNNIR